MGTVCLQTSVVRDIGLGRLRELLAEKVTVLAGHSGVGKSSLVAAIEPGLDIRVAEVSDAHLKGRHTTTSARRYELRGGGAVIDTPGVKLFGLWGVTADNLEDFFPDVAAGTAPAWRRESFERIRASLAAG
jgi:ribosome biogenesis GTPase